MWLHIPPCVGFSNPFDQMLDVVPPLGSLLEPTPNSLLAQSGVSGCM